MTTNAHIFILQETKYIETLPKIYQFSRLMEFTAKHMLKIWGIFLKCFWTTNVYILQ